MYDRERSYDKPEHELLDGTTLGIVTAANERNDFGGVTGYPANICIV